MPIYEYQCTACEHKVEVMQKISDGPLKVCPSCSQESMKKLVSAVGFQLKGTGWYETDFKGKKPKTDSGSDSAPSSEPGKVEAKSETKSETKTDTKTAAST